MNSMFRSLIASILAINVTCLHSSDQTQLSDITHGCATSIATIQKAMQQAENACKKKFSIDTTVNTKNYLSVTIENNDVILKCQGAQSIVTIKPCGYSVPEDHDDNVLHLKETLLDQDDKEIEDLSERMEAYQQQIEEIKELLESVGTRSTVYVNIAGCIAKNEEGGVVDIDSLRLALFAHLMARTIPHFDTIDNLVLLCSTEEEYDVCLQLGIFTTQTKLEKLIEKETRHTK